MPAAFSRLPLRPAVWMIAIAGLAAADVAAPAGYGVCVFTLVILPVAWGALHRRHVPALTAVLLLAVVGVGLIRIAIADHAASETSAGEATASAIAGWPFPLAPVRLWTVAALASAGVFHLKLQQARRRRLALRRDLQERVRQRARQVSRANRALREEVLRRQETEHLLDRSESTFKALMDRMQLQVTRKNTDGVFIYANEPFCRILGMRPAEVIGRTDADLFPSDLAAGYRADDRRVMESGQAVDQVEEHPRPGGESGFVQVFKAPEYDQDGNCIGVQIIFWDITQKHRAEIALRNSEARKRALFEAAGDAVLLVGGDLRVVEANASAARLFHTPVAELVDRRLDEIAVPDGSVDSDAELGRLDGVLSSSEGAASVWNRFPKARRREVALRRGDGSTFESEVSVHQIPIGDSDGMAIIVRDVTLKRRAFEALRRAKAAAEAANQTKTDFMAGVSHELRTPLSGITGLVELLAESELSRRDRQYVDLIRQSTALLSDVIEDILDFAALEAGRVQIDPEAVDLHAVVSDALRCLASRARNKPLRLVLAIDPATPRHVIADAKRIRQIIINLAGNAIKFTDEGEVQLRLSGDAPRAADQPASIAPVTIEVSDTGVGIAEEEQARIFNAFERGQDGTTRVHGGTGLGLSISKGLARQMGGDINVRSRTGDGSTFRCRLELSADPDAPKSPRERPTADAARRRRKGVIRYSRAIVTTGSPAMDAAICQTLRQFRLDCRSGGDGRVSDDSARSDHDSVLFVVSDAGPFSELAEARQPGDCVVWITRIGDPPPVKAEPADPVLIEPVIPDELLSAVRGMRAEVPVEGNAIDGDESLNARSGDGHGGGTSRDAQTGEQSRAAAAVPRTRKPRVLLADDSDVNRLVIHDLLTREGYRVEAARRGDEAIRMAEEQLDSLADPDPNRGPADPYLAILMDVQMPDMDGTEATRRIRARYHRRRAAMPPVIALTAHVTSEHRRLCEQAGMNGFLTKPVAAQRLLRELQRHISAFRKSSLGRSQPTFPAPKAVPSPAEAKADRPRSDAGGRSGERDAEAWRERMKAHGGHHPATVISLCDAFLEEVPALADRVRRSAETGDAATLRTAAHTLKSCLRYVADADDVSVAAHLESTSAQPEQITPDQLDSLEEIAEKWTRRVRHLRDEQTALPTN